MHQSNLWKLKRLWLIDWFYHCRSIGGTVNSELKILQKRSKNHFSGKRTKIYINYNFCFILFCFGAKEVRGRRFPVWAARKMERERKHERRGGGGESKGKRYAGYVSNRDLKIRGWWRQQNRRRESEFALFQSSSRLLQVTNFVKCRWTLLKLNSYEPHPPSERERKFHRRLCTSPVKRKIRHFHVVVVQWGRRKVQKSVMCKLVDLVIKPIAFLTFSLPSPSSDLKNPNESPRRQMLKQLF